MALKKDKRGITTVAIIISILIALFLMIFLGVLAYGAGKAEDLFGQMNFTLGNTSFQTVYTQTLGIGIEALHTTVPQIISSGVLLGMILLMFLVGYYTKKKNQLWILLDIFILIVAEGVAVLVTESFTTYMENIGFLLEVYRDILPIGAKFILNLPVIVPILGAIIMITTYYITKDSSEEKQEEGDTPFPF